ncbi:MAG TPA: alpha/beta hydrolase [Chitinophagaceae bacterium]|jgi:proline iminopeptidase|nr:alpha/beta hydrolase [Chitinophagaceae bacterium]
MKRLMLFLLVPVVYFQTYAQKDGFAQSDGVKIYYRTFGTGTPILIINGGPGLNSDGFVDLAKTLSAQNQTIIYDQRGTGKSVMQIDASSITMELMIDDIENLRKELKIERWIILGHSFGGMLASYYATIHPSRIISMILSSSGGIDLDLLSYVAKNINARLTPQQQDSASYWSQKINNGDTSYFARWQRAKVLANAYVYDKKYALPIAERLTQSDLRVNNLIWQNMQKIKFNCAPKLSTFTKPVLIIQGKQDIIEEWTSQKANKILKNSKLVILDHCVHYGWLDNRDMYLSEVEKFISGN